MVSTLLKGPKSKHSSKVPGHLLIVKPVKFKGKLQISNLQGRRVYPHSRRENLAYWGAGAKYGTEERQTPNTNTNPTAPMLRLGRLGWLCLLPPTSFSLQGWFYSLCAAPHVLPSPKSWGHHCNQASPSTASHKGPLGSSCRDFPPGLAALSQIPHPSLLASSASLTPVSGDS